MIQTPALPSSAQSGLPAKDQALRKLADYMRPHAAALAGSPNSSSPLGHAQRQARRGLPIIDFAHQFYYIPETEQPIQLTHHQQIILNRMFDWAVDQLGCQTLIYSAPKKSGKTAIGSLVARWVTETWGSHVETLAVANDLEQARGRTYAGVLRSLELDPRYDRQRREIPGLWHVIERQATYLPTNSTLRAASGDYKGEAGSNPVATIWSELWGYSLEASRRLWDELTPVPTRKRSIRFVETYAGFMGESDILWDLYELATKPAHGSKQLTLDDVPDWPWPSDALTGGLPLYINLDAGIFAYWDDTPRGRRMPWHTPQYYQQQSKILRPNAFDRLHSNVWVSSTSSFIPTEWWDACADPTVTPPPIGSNIPVVIAADASVSGDCTAITMHRRDPKDHNKTQLCASRVWTPPPNGKMNYSETIEPAIREWCANYNVVQFAYDQYQLHDLATRLRDDGVVWVRSFSQNAERMVADYGLYCDIRDQRISHYGDPSLKEHMVAAAARQAKDEDTKLRIVKKAASSKIDLVVCASMGNHEIKRLLV